MSKPERLASMELIEKSIASFIFELFWESKPEVFRRGASVFVFALAFANATNHHR
jgi:hypothetical protein